MKWRRRIVVALIALSPSPSLSNVVGDSRTGI